VHPARAGHAGRGLRGVLYLVLVDEAVAVRTTGWWRENPVRIGILSHALRDASPFSGSAAGAFLVGPAQIGQAGTCELLFEWFQGRSVSSDCASRARPGCVLRGRTRASPGPHSQGGFMSLLREPNAEPIPGYRLIEPLGSGGFGEVWKCEGPGGLLKAIKFVYGSLKALDDEGVRADQEFKSLSRVKEVRHPFVLSTERIDVLDG